MTKEVYVLRIATGGLQHGLGVFDKLENAIAWTIADTLKSNRLLKKNEMIVWEHMPNSKQYRATCGATSYAIDTVGLNAGISEFENTVWKEASQRAKDIIK